MSRGRPTKYSTWIVPPDGNSGVFIIECIANKRSYIGSSKDIKTRVTLIRGDLVRGKHKCADLQRDFNLLGPEAFKVSLLEVVIFGDIVRCRKSWIEIYRIQGIDLYNEQHKEE